MCVCARVYVCMCVCVYVCMCVCVCVSATAGAHTNPLSLHCCCRSQNLTMLDVTDHAYAALHIVAAAGSAQDASRGTSGRYNNGMPKPLTIVQLATRYSTKEKVGAAGGRVFEIFRALVVSLHNP